MINYQPEDFNKMLDHQLFVEWKEALKAHQATASTTMILFVLAFASMLAIGGLIGLALFFGLMLASIFITMPKRKVAAECQRKLGITNQDIKEAAVKARKRK